MKIPPRNELSSALRVARRARGLSQEDFGGVSGRTYVSQIERGERQATLSKIDDLASVLEVHPASLVVLAYLPIGLGQDAAGKLLDRIRADLETLLSAYSEVKRG